MNYFLDAMKKFADFSGRARRKDYWMFVLIYVIISFLIAIVESIIGTSFLSAVYGLILFVPTISIAARRLHDTGRSGWWQLIGLIPIVGWIILIIFFVQDSHPENEYGPSPN